MTNQTCAGGFMFPGDETPGRWVYGVDNYTPPSSNVHSRPTTPREGLKQLISSVLSLDLMGLGLIV